MQDKAVEALIARLSEQDRSGLEYHAHPDRRSSCGSMATDMSLLLSGLVDFAKDGRLELTAHGEAVRAALRARGAVK